MKRNPRPILATCGVLVAFSTVQADVVVLNETAFDANPLLSNIYQNPVVSRNSITTECADFQSVGRGVIVADSDSALRFRTVRLCQ
jgi:hypothetical protein